MGQEMGMVAQMGQTIEDVETETGAQENQFRFKNLNYILLISITILNIIYLNKRCGSLVRQQAMISFPGLRQFKLSFHSKSLIFEPPII